MIFTFGRFVVQVEDFANLFTGFPRCWQAAETTAENKAIDAVLIVERASDNCCDALVDGWQAEDVGEKRKWVYAENGNYLFSLQCNPLKPQDVRVEVHYPGKQLCLGMQYGLMLALNNKCMGLHGVTLLCGNEIIILSAPSGTGKTTLAHLLEQYADAIVINGDFALLSETECGIVFEPTPFCGTSGRCLNQRVRVDRVVFLEQSPMNHWSDLTGREAMTRFMSNTFVPMWDEGMKKTVQQNVMKCVSALKVNSFAFAPTQEAAEMFVNRLCE